MKRLVQKTTLSESKYATVLIPTFNNVQTLPYSLRSVQMQNFSDMEIFVVGDGAPPITRDLVHSFANSDSRIRFFEFPKGERRGEAHRATVLTQASGQIICYCADDDLWLPFHLKSMVSFLKTVDFGHSWSVEVDEFGRIHGNGGDIGDPVYRKMMCTSQCVNIGLTALGHTTDAYRRLPGGWHPAPSNIGTDLYMCRRFFAIEGLRFGTLHEPSTIRFGPWSWMQQFHDHETPVEGTPVGGGDIADWINRIEKPEFRAAFKKAFLASVARRVGFGIHADHMRLKEVHNLVGEIRNRDAEIVELCDEMLNRSSEIERLGSEIRNRDAEIDRRRCEVLNRRSEIERLGGEIHNREAEIEGLRREVHSRSSEIERLGGQIRNRDAEIVELCDEVLNRRSDIERLEGEKHNHDTEIEGLRRDVVNRRSEIERLGGEIHNRNVEIEGLRREVINRSSDIERLGGEVHNRNAEIEGLRRDVVNRSSEIERLGGEVHNHEAEIEGLRREVHNRRSEIERLRGEIRNRDVEIEDLCGEVSNRSREIARMIEQHRAILASASWRLTAPARSLKTWIGGAISRATLT